MSEQTPETEPENIPLTSPEPDPYVVYDVVQPEVDYFEKSADQSGQETRDTGRD